jgi:hypothetical protein
MHEQPPFLLALLSNISKKRPLRFGASNVSICFVITVLVCKNNKKYINLTCGRFTLKGRGQIPPQPTKFAVFSSFDSYFLLLNNYLNIPITPSATRTTFNCIGISRKKRREEVSF